MSLEFQEENKEWLDFAHF
jgi:hypothetical protein